MPKRVKYSNGGKVQQFKAGVKSLYEKTGGHVVVGGGSNQPTGVRAGLNVTEGAKKFIVEGNPKTKTGRVALEYTPRPGVKFGISGSKQYGPLGKETVGSLYASFGGKN